MADPPRLTPASHSSTRIPAKAVENLNYANGETVGLELKTQPRGVYLHNSCRADEEAPVRACARESTRGLSARVQAAKHCERSLVFRHCTPSPAFNPRLVFPERRTLRLSPICAHSPFAGPAPAAAQLWISKCSYKTRTQSH